MSDFNIRLDPSLASRALAETIFVDVGERVIDSRVVRDGVDVGIFEIDEGVLDDIVVTHPVAQRVVSQSIAAGTSVAVGTTIDLELGPTRRFPAGVVAGVLEAVRERPLGELHDQLVAGHLDDATRILRKVGPGNTLPQAEEALLVSLFESEDLAVGDDVSGAIETLRAAKTFGA